MSEVNTSVTRLVGFMALVSDTIRTPERKTKHVVDFFEVFLCEGIHVREVFIVHPVVSLHLHPDNRVGMANVKLSCSPTEIVVVELEEALRLMVNKVIAAAPTQP